MWKTRTGELYVSLRKHRGETARDEGPDVEEVIESLRSKTILAHSALLGERRAFPLGHSRTCFIRVDELPALGGSAAFFDF